MRTFRRALSFSIISVYCVLEGVPAERSGGVEGAAQDQAAVLLKRTIASLSYDGAAALWRRGSPSEALS